MAEQDQEEQDKQQASEDAKDPWSDARKRLESLEDDPPKKLEDWPTDEGKYVTFGGGEGDHGYEEGPEVNLGPSSLRRHEDGNISIAGEEVDNPDDYKSDEGQISLAIEKEDKDD